MNDLFFATRRQFLHRGLTLVGGAATVPAFLERTAWALAGPDDLYAERGAETIEALRGAGAKHVILAGKPKDLKVDDSAAVGADALAFLQRTREALG